MEEDTNQEEGTKLFITPWRIKDQLYDHLEKVVHLL